jgi:hypothetical protein
VSEALARLAVKYRTLARWRRERAEGRTMPERAEFRAMSEEFPGALRELDVMELDAIDARAAALERASRGDEPTLPWMLATEAFHRWMRAALWVKRHARGARIEHDRLARECEARNGVRADREFVASAIAPERGRLRPMVLARVAIECAITEDEARTVVLGRASR